MSLCKNSSCLLLLVSLYIYALVSRGEVNVTAAESADQPKQAPSLSPVFEPGSLFSLQLLSSFPEDLEISRYCSDLLRIFGLKYVSYVDCLVTAARPVQMCQKCFSTYGSLMDTYVNISSDQMGPGNESCRDSLLRSDRLMLVYLLYSNMEDIWTKSQCDQCVTKGYQSLTNDTLYFMDMVNRTVTCFRKYQQGNYTDLCKDCKKTYKGLNELYGKMETNLTMCIDIEDSMNMTRRLWSKNFNCSFPREETVPVIAVSSFMLFLPIIFYLSSFLHSEQKKRKLIHPKRAKSYSSLMNIQNKLS